MNERVLLLERLQEDEKARRRDLPDLVFFMLATGVRLGEALATVWSDVDFEVGTVRITSTLVRVKGRGAAAEGHQEPGRGADPPLPVSAVAMLRRRFMTGRVSTSACSATYRAASPTQRTGGGTARGEGEDTLAWITSHTFRRTAATILDEAAPRLPWSRTSSATAGRR